MHIVKRLNVKNVTDLTMYRGDGSDESYLTTPFQRESQKSQEICFEAAMSYTSWWLSCNPFEKHAQVKLASSSTIFGVKIKNIWVATT